MLKLVDDYTSYVCIPYVISPLHSPEGRKAHYHIIFDNTELCLGDNFFDDLQSKFNCPDWHLAGLVKNIRRAELYLTHSTPDSSNKQQFSKSDIETMVFGHGYELHKNTYRGERKNTSDLIAYIRLKLLDLIDKGDVYINTATLTNAVRSPDFYIDCDVDIDVKTAIGKGLNEVMLHYKFYLDYARDVSDKKAQEDNHLDREDRRECADIYCKALCDIISNQSESVCSRILYTVYCNCAVLRPIVKQLGGLSNCDSRALLLSLIAHCSNFNVHSDSLVLLTAIDNAVNQHVTGGIPF